MQQQTTPTNIYKEHQWLRQMLLELLLWFVLTTLN
jgi:hypothetical protein